MNAEQLLKELIIRFNTDPKRYEKLDYGVLIKLLSLLVTSKADIDAWLDIVTPNAIQFDIKEDGVLSYTLNGKDWLDLGTINGQDGVTPLISDNGNWYIGNVDTGIKAKADNVKIENKEWYINEEPTGNIAVPTIEIIDGYWYIDGEDTGIKAESDLYSIGDDNLWYKNDESTGLRAIPEIGIDTKGDWEINGVSTLKPSRGKNGGKIILNDATIIFDGLLADDYNTALKGKLESTLNNLNPALTDADLFVTNINDNKYTTTYLVLLISVDGGKQLVYTPVFQAHSKPTVYYFPGEFDNNEEDKVLLLKVKLGISMLTGVSLFVRGDQVVCISVTDTKSNPRLYWYDGNDWATYTPDDSLAPSTFDE